ncbi:hypothetical protein [Staphylococcus capitis]|uniref:hypothetical protein n=1 Tax=Staphylococcus capitis TaxID=29388 RepID=UPI00145A044E|nr:hypothetical protein [Staphylococcus capitis]NMK72238.1 hypothetical protein [Staphylococcus capitis]
MNNIELIKQTIENENACMDNDLTYTFKYKGYTAKIKRIEEHGYLCGYVNADVLRNSREYEIIDEHAHGGVTFHNGDWVGFDCAHFGDFSLWRYELFENDDTSNLLIMNEYEVYRDFEYVKSNLQNIIDELVKVAR